MGMMPDKKKLFKDYYKNPSALLVSEEHFYEEKIINEIIKKGKSNKRSISKLEAEK